MIGRRPVVLVGVVRVRRRRSGLRPYGAAVHIVDRAGAAGGLSEGLPTLTWAITSPAAARCRGTSATRSPSAPTATPSWSARRTRAAPRAGINGNAADNSLYNSGAVYVFVRRGDAWVQQAYVKASNAGQSDLFGMNVALSADGNTMAVAAPWERSAATGINGDQNDDSLPQAGAVYVFTRSGDSWSQQAYVKASNTGRRADERRRRPVRLLGRLERRRQHDGRRRDHRRQRRDRHQRQPGR